MDESDKELKISIVTQAEGTGIEDTTEDLEKIRERLHGVYQESRDFRQLFFEIDRVLPGIGSEMLALVSGPFGAAAAAFSGLILLSRSLKEEMKSMNEEAKKFLDIAGQPDAVDNMQKQAAAIAQSAADMQALADNASSYMDNINSVATALEQQLKTLQAIERERAALESAQKALAIANIQAQEASGAMTPEQAAAARKEVEIQALQKQAQDKDRAQAEEIRDKTNALIAAQNQKAELDQKFADADAKRRRDQAHQDAVSLDPKKQLEAIHALQQQIQEMQRIVENPTNAEELGRRAAIVGGSQIERAQAQLARLEEQLRNFQQSQSPEAQAKLQADKDAAAAAKKAADDNAKLIGDLTKQLADLKTAITATRPLQQQTTATQEATILTDAVAGDFKTITDALKQHGPSARLTLEQVRDALADAAQTLQALAALGVDVKNFQQQLNALKQQVASIKSSGIQ